MEEKTVYIKLREDGVYDCDVTEGPTNNLYLELNDPGLEYDSIYIPKDIPLTKSAIGSYSLIDEIIVNLD